MLHFEKFALARMAALGAALTLAFSVGNACREAGKSAAAPAAAPSKGYEKEARLIRESGLGSEKAYGLLARILEAGPRLTGSEGAARGVDICLALMKENGFDRPHTEKITVNRWVRNEGQAWVENSGGADKNRPLHVAALGNSVATPAGGLTADLIEVRSFDELKKLGRAVEGKIVLFNGPMDRKSTEAFAAYGKAAAQRVNGASAAAALGASAVLIRSLTFRMDDNPHTGMMTYDPKQPKIPAAAVSTNDAEYLARILASGAKVRVHLRLSCRDEGPVPSANVVGDITGSEHPEEVVLLGGHLDSWDLGVGAQDDASGCAVSLEALRLIKELGLKPKRTIRAVMFMDEEFGGTGGKFYVAAPERRGEKHILAMESDRGAFAPIALAVGNADGKLTVMIRRYEKIFATLGITSITPGGGGVDVGPLVGTGVPPAAVITDAQPYFDFHHSALDTLSSVHPRLLELQAVIMATLAYIIAEEDLPR